MKFYQQFSIIDNFGFIVTDRVQISLQLGMPYLFLNIFNMEQPEIGASRGSRVTPFSSWMETTDEKYLNHYRCIRKRLSTVLEQRCTTILHHQQGDPVVKALFTDAFVLVNFKIRSVAICPYIYGTVSLRGRVVPNPKEVLADLKELVNQYPIL